MAAPATAHGLSATDLPAIREAVAAGRRPKVVFTRSAGQIAGQIGQVVRLDDPAAGADWIVVRFGRDELPFSPADLAIPPKSTPARRGTAKPTVDSKIADSKKTTASSANAPTPVIPAPAVPAARVVPAPREEKPVSPSTAPAAPSAVATPTPTAAPGATAQAAPTEKRATKAAKPKAPASLTVTLAYTDREWTVAAQQGQKSLAKPYVIRPSDALRMVAMLDVPGVQDAVEHIIAAERAEAEGQAHRLRAELAEIEARLSELTSTD